MNKEALENLNDENSKQPLEHWGFRFYPTSRFWRQVGTQSERMLVNVTRSRVAERVGVTEGAIESWEYTTLSGNVPSEDDAKKLLQVCGGSVNSSPLLRWRLQFFPASKSWRRATASRNEVSRAVVAKQVGIQEEIIIQWEAAIIRVHEGGDLA